MGILAVSITIGVYAMTMFSPLRPRPLVKSDKYAGVRDMTPKFRTGTQRVMNGKPNRGDLARATNRFIAEAVVPFPFWGEARAELVPLRNVKGQYRADTRRIPTITEHWTWDSRTQRYEPHASGKATWVVKSE